MRAIAWARPLAGEMAGMSGGVVIVHGDAGARAGDRLRRGLIVVEGRSGKDAGSRMIAGTLVLRGKVAGAPGPLMRRGTIVLLDGRLSAFADIPRLRLASIGRVDFARCRARDVSASALRASSGAPCAVSPGTWRFSARAKFGSPLHCDP